MFHVHAVQYSQFINRFIFLLLLNQHVKSYVPRQLLCSNHPCVMRYLFNETFNIYFWGNQFNGEWDHGNTGTKSKAIYVCSVMKYL